MTDPNEDLIRQGFDAHGRGDIEALKTQFFAPDIEWHFPGHSPFAGDHQGVDQVAEHFRNLGIQSGGTHRLELQDVIANDDFAVALHTTRAERAGKQLEINVVQVFRIRDGKITEAWTTHSDPDAFDEFWA
jgi:ketosteroid isomerase-like protein